MQLSRICIKLHDPRDGICRQMLQIFSLPNIIESTSAECFGTSHVGKYIRNQGGGGFPKAEHGSELDSPR